MTLDRCVALCAPDQDTIEVRVVDLRAWLEYQENLLTELRIMKDLLWDKAVRDAFPDPKPLDGA